MATTLNLKSVNGEVIKIKVKQDPASIITGQTAVSGALNLSAEGLYAQNNNGVLEFKGLQAANGITLSSSSTGVTIGYSGGTGNYVTEATFTGYTASTETRLQGIESDIVYVSGVTDNKLNTSIFNGYTASTSSVLSGIDDDINYLSGQTSLKVNTSLFNAYTASTDVVIDNALTGVTVGTNLAVNNSNPRKPHITFTGSTGVGDVTHAQLDPWTGATDTRLDNLEADIVYLSGQTAAKVNTSLFNTYTGSTATALSNINSELDLALTGVTAGANLSAIQTGRVVNITFTGSTGGGSITGATNLGSGNGVFAQVNGDNLEFKSLVAGSNITITPSSTGLTIASTGGGGGSSYASGITYQNGGTNITGTTVQQALTELDRTNIIDVFFTTSAVTFTYRSPVDQRITAIDDQAGTTATLKVGMSTKTVGDTINQFDDLDITITGSAGLVSVKFLEV